MVFEEFGLDIDEMAFPGFDFGEEPHRVPHEKSRLGPVDINRWSSWIKPYPLPPHLTPVEQGDWSDLSDETLLSMPPSLICHLQRTAAQGGLQIVSPRQIPLSSLMGRAIDPNRSITDFVVGSIADPYDEWPTIDDASFDMLLPDEPLPPRDTEKERALREKTRTVGVSSMSGLTRDPVVACLVKGRAVIDLLGRDDIAGDADGMTKLLADAWGIPVEQLMDLDAYTLGLEGPLLRHAIRSDVVYPMVHAPIHQKMCVSVGNSEINRDMLPLNSVMDWRRMRVFCEAVFLMTCSIEGIPLKDVRCSPPPGDPSAPLTRPNILAFRPMPCTAWTFDPMTFSVCPVVDVTSREERCLPPEVVSAVDVYLKRVKPISYALSQGKIPAARKTMIKEPDIAPGETLTSGYNLALERIVTGGARGKTAAATVRNVIYDVLDAAPLSVRLRIARYIHIAQKEVETHLGLSVVPDGIIDRLALKIAAIGESIRSKIVAEATRRGARVDEWWSDLLASAPMRYSDLKEGTMGWVRIGLWLLFRGTTERWTKLASATHFSALKRAELESVGSMALPPEKGSLARVLTAARSVVSNISRAYAGYYVAVYDVGMAISDEMVLMGNAAAADTIREASYLWMLRARAFRGTNVDALSKDSPCKSPNHFRIEGKEFDLVIAPAPYRAFTSYKCHLKETKVVNTMAKHHIENHKSTRLSEVFSSMWMPLGHAKESVTTRYLIDPRRLGNDMEKSWMEVRNDVARMIATMDGETVRTDLKANAPVLFSLFGKADEIVLAPTRQIITDEGETFADVTAMMDYDEVEFFEDIMNQLGIQREMEIRDMRFLSQEALRRYFLNLENEIIAGTVNNNETVL